MFEKINSAQRCILSILMRTIKSQMALLAKKRASLLFSWQLQELMLICSKMSINILLIQSRKINFLQLVGVIFQEWKNFWQQAESDERISSLFARNLFSVHLKFNFDSSKGSKCEHF